MGTITSFFEELKNNLEQYDLVGLATVTRSYGSAPREAGAQQWILPGGKNGGTVGGGSLEAHTLKEMAELLASEEKTRILKYNLRPDTPGDLGMICGGDVDLLLQKLTKKSLPLITRLLQGLANRERLWLGLCEAGDGLVLLSGETELLARGSDELPELPGLEQLKMHKTRVEPHRMEGWFFLPLLLPGRTILFGGGHVGQSVVRAAGELDLSLVVFEDRPEFATKEVLPNAEQIILGDFNRVADFIQIDENDQVCILTRGHMFDYIVLTQVLRTEAGYIGLMGSRRKIKVTMDKLRAEGFTDEDIARIHTPIGLDIHAQTPGEIAISILGQLILDRYERNRQAGAKNLGAIHS